MTVEKTFRFPGGSLILYSHPNELGEIVLYSKKNIVCKVFGNLTDLEQRFDNLVQEIEQEFIKIAKQKIGWLYDEKRA